MSFFTFAILLSCLSSTFSQGACPLPAEPACVVRSSQFVVLGTVTKNNMASPDASPRSYNASIAIQCVWGSFSSPPSNGYGLVDTIVPVQGFGKPLANCPNGSGSDATEGTTQIFFIYMQKGVMTGPNYYAVSNPCAGPLAYTPENLEMIAGILKASPANKMSDEFRGSKEQCILPTTVNGAPIAATSTKPRTVINIPPPASGAIHLIGSSLLVGLLTLSVMYL